MKPFFALVIAAALITAGTVWYVAEHHKSSNPRMLKTASVSTPVADAWVSWKQIYGKSYGTDSEEQYRLSVFSVNYNKINNIPADVKATMTYTVGLNKFSDMSSAEFKSTYLKTFPNQQRVRNFVDLPTDNLPKSVDWRGKAVTPVKDQGQCGSCWAFSTTGGSEGLYATTNGSIKSFSEQQLVDCAPLPNQGCSGGLMDEAFKYVESKGLMLESDYRYTAEGGKCKYDSEKVAFKFSGYTDVAVDNDSALMAAVVKQPISIAMAADAIQSYVSGIFNDWSCGDQLDHGVLLVGYGSENGKDYWIVKNSWGTVFGEQGYIRLARRATGEGICGITKQASYPTA